MSQNRYTPPGADLRTAADDPSLGTGDFDIGLCLSEAWAATWANFPLWLGTLFVLWITATIATLTVIGLFLVVPVLFWGGVRFFLAMRDGDASFGDIFSGFSRYGSALGSMLLVFFATFLVSFVGPLLSQIGVAADSGLIQFIGMLVQFGVALLVSPRLMFAPFLVVDRDMAGIDALRYSWEVTNRTKWKLIGLLFLNVVLGIAGFVCLIVGMIPAFVMGYLLMISAYRQVVGGPGVQPA